MKTRSVRYDKATVSRLDHRLRQAARPSCSRNRKRVTLGLLGGWLAVAALPSAPAPASSFGIQAIRSGGRGVYSTSDVIVVDLRPALLRRPLRAGRHIVYEQKNRFTLVALVKGGNVVGYRATDRKGKKLRLIITQDPLGSSIRKHIEEMRKWETPEERRKRKQEEFDLAIEEMIAKLESEKGGKQEKGCWIIGYIEGTIFVSYGPCGKGV